MEVVAGNTAQQDAAQAEPAGSGDFVAAAEQVLDRLRAALVDVVANVPGNVSKPGDLQRALKIDAKLSWKMLKVVNASGPLAAGPHVPGFGALRTFLAAAKKLGMKASLIQAATTATAEFERLVDNHAGNRTAFDSMISSLAEHEDAQQITLLHRRAAFRANGHIYGIQGKTLLKCIVAQPSDDPRSLDLVRIMGHLSLRQLRADAPLIVSRVPVTSDNGAVCEVHQEPLDPSGDPASGIALLSAFCSQPTPEFRTYKGPGNVYSELISHGLGKEAAITCLDGRIARAAVPRYAEVGNRQGASAVRVRVPCEVLLFDFVVHEDAYGLLKPRVYNCAEHWAELPGPAPDLAPSWPQHHPQESIAYLGKGPAMLYAAEFPRYGELGRYVFERLGWDGQRFDVYRCRVEYPVIPSTVMMTFDLPEAPE